MDNVLLDTNVILRFSQVDSDLETLADISVKKLARKGDILYLTPQVICEYWCSVTHPMDVNGFGWDSSAAYDSIIKLIGLFTIIPRRLLFSAIGWNYYTNIVSEAREHTMCV